MYNAKTLPVNNKRSNQYVTNGILTAKPEELIMKIYDFAIINSKKNNMAKTNEALQALINALNFDHPAAKEISANLLNIYLYCQEQMRKQKNDDVTRILSELRDTWRTALLKR
jgi:flagellin-specific chaperone FliS